MSGGEERVAGGNDGVREASMMCSIVSNRVYYAAETKLLMQGWVILTTPSVTSNKRLRQLANRKPNVILRRRMRESTNRFLCSTCNTRGSRLLSQLHTATDMDDSLQYPVSDAFFVHKTTQRV